MRQCTVCHHTARLAIEAAVIGGQSSRSVATGYGLDHRAVHRHTRNHLPATIRDAAALHVAQLNAIETLASESGIAIAGPTEPAEGGFDMSREGDGRGRSGHRGRAIMLDDTPLPIETIAVQPVATPIAAPPPPMGVLALVHDLRDRALAILAQAETAGDPKTALAAIREARGLLETLARLEPQPLADAGASLTSMSEWTRVRTALLSALAPFPEARIAAAIALASTGALA